MVHGRGDWDKDRSKWQAFLAIYVRAVPTIQRLLLAPDGLLLIAENQTIGGKDDLEMARGALLLAREDLKAIGKPNGRAFGRLVNDLEIVLDSLIKAVEAPLRLVDDLSRPVIAGRIVLMKWEARDRLTIGIMAMGVVLATEVLKEISEHVDTLWHLSQSQ